MADDSTADVAQYDNLRLQITELEDKLMSNIRDPERFIRCGSFVKVRGDDGTDYDWGVVVNAGNTPESFDTVHMVDIFLHVSPGSTDNKSPPNPCPPPPIGQKCEVSMVSVPLHQVRAISSLRMILPRDLNELHSAENRDCIRLFLEAARGKYYPKISLKVCDLVVTGSILGNNLFACEAYILPSPEPALARASCTGFTFLSLKRIRLDEDERALDTLVKQLEQLERSLLAHPLHQEFLKTPQSMESIKDFQIKREKFNLIQKLRDQLAETQLEIWDSSVRRCLLVLEKLGHDGSMELKGQAACLIDTGNELLVSEPMFDGTFDEHQIASLASCLLPGDYSNQEMPSIDHLAGLLEQVNICAQKIAKGDIIQVAKGLVGFLSKLSNVAERAGLADLRNNILTARESMEALRVCLLGSRSRSRSRSRKILSRF